MDFVWLNLGERWIKSWILIVRRWFDKLFDDERIHKEYLDFNTIDNLLSNFHKIKIKLFNENFCCNFSDKISVYN